MRTIGLLGGMSWESSAIYYRLINQEVGQRLGQLHSAKLVLFSVDFHEVEKLQAAGDWPALARMLIDVAQKLRAGGADFLLLCTNTMHKVYEEIATSVDLPVLHIADPTAAQLLDSGLCRVGLVGTRYTMEQEFYRERLQAKYGISVLIPEENDRAIVHRVIYDELCVGKIDSESRNEFRRILALLVERGAQAIILGCTEIAMLVGPEDCTVPLFDTAAIHAKAAVAFSLDLVGKP